MRKIYVFLLVSIMILIGINDVYALEVKQESLSVKEKSNTITVTDEGIGDLSINPKIEFNEVGDFITYKLVLKNTDSNKYKIESVTDNNQNESIKVIFDYNTEMNTDNKEMLITLKYDKIPTNPDEALKNIKVTIKLIDEDNNQEEININDSNNESNQNENNNSTVNTNTNNTIDNNVKTGDNIKTNIWLLLLSLTVLCITITYLVKTKKYNKGLLSILLILTIIPTFVYANTTKDITFDINFKNIKINVKHKVTLDSNGGTLPNDEVTIKHGEEIGTLPVPTPPEGKEFDGWYKDNTKIEDDYVVTGNETLVAKYKLTEYTITYNLDEGTVTTANQATYTIETDTFTLNNPAKKGYKFLGWTGSNGNTPQKEVKIEKGTTGNKEYTANFLINEYTITYDSNGGSNVASETKKYNETFTEPTKPTKNKHEFIKWVDEQDNDYDFSRKVTKDITLKAVWIELFTVTYDSDGGSNVDSEMVRKNEKYTKPQNPERTGYDFVKWLDENNNEYDFNALAIKDIILKAEWKEKIATFEGSYAFNTKLKKILGGKNNFYVDSTITAFKRATTLPDGFIPTNDNLASTPDSQVPIYIWNDNGIFYFYSDANRIKVNRDQSQFFGRFSALVDVDDYLALDFSDVTNTSQMFIGCESYTDLSPLANLDMSKVTNMHGMFSDITNLEDLSPLENWDTSKVTNMSGLFSGDEKISVIPLENWDTSNVIDMGYMFYGNKNLSDISALENWDTSKVNYMLYMFYGNKNLSDISALENWDTSKVTNMSSMFSGSTILEDISPLENWDTSKVTDMSNMFTSTGLEDISPLENWDISNVTNMRYMFANDKNLVDISYLSNWDTSKVTNFSGVFSGNSNMTSINGLENWNTSNAINMSYLFKDTSNLIDISALENWDTSKVTDMSKMFESSSGLSSLEDLSPLENWDTSSVTNMGGMFRYNRKISDISPLKKWDTSKVTNMTDLFSWNNLTDLTPLKNWDTSKVTNMSYMFSSNGNLEDLSPLENWDTSSVINMGHLFRDTSLNDLTPLKNWDTSNVTNMSNTFYKTLLTDLAQLKNWNTSSVVYMDSMFFENTELIDASGINDWDISKVKSFNLMFGLNAAGGSSLNPVHPTFSKVIGTWDNKGTFIPNS